MKYTHQNHNSVIKKLQYILFTLLASCSTQYVTAADYKINVMIYKTFGI